MCSCTRYALRCVEIYILSGLPGKHIEFPVREIYRFLITILFLSLSAYTVDKEGILLSKPKPIFYSALMLTAVNLLLRFAGTTFQVYLSRRIGAAGIGLLQLTMSVGSLALVAGMAGVRTAAMYLCAEELGRKRPGQIIYVLSGCFCYSILFSGAAGTALYHFAPWLAEYWIGDSRTADALQLLAAFLPATCLCGVMTGFFTAANRIGTLAAVEVAEQLAGMSITLAALKFWAGNDPGRACLSVILGSSAGACLTLLCLIALHLFSHPKRGQVTPVRRRLIGAALPLGAGDLLKSGINTVENLMVPRRLAMHPGTAAPLAAFGMVSGMVFPVVMFPACILFALAELLIPELARCSAAGSRTRICYLVRRGLQIALLYGCLFSGLLYLAAEPLCLQLYGNPAAAPQMKHYALLIPMLYCDAITDAMTKGLGQQTACVRYNILTSALDVLGLFLLLPRYGMTGYFISFTITHALNFLLSLRRLLKITRQKLPLHYPMLTLSGMCLSTFFAGFVPLQGFKAVCYFAVLLSFWTLSGVMTTGTLRWIRSVARLQPR